MTIPDLTTFRVPMFHQEQNVDLVSDIRDIAPRMDLLITESEHTKKDVIELLGVAADRVAVTPLAAHEQFEPVSDPARRQSVLEKHGLGGRPYILNIGTLEPRKNHRRLIEAFHRLKAAGDGANHLLVLVGGKGWLYDEVFQTVVNYGLQADVKWLGYVPYADLPALISAADVFVYPSLYEGFGLPPLEAMRCGAAVIASNTTSIPEVVGDAGVLIDPENIDAIAAAIHEVLTTPELRASLQQKSLTRARSFTWERTARLTLDAYKVAQRHAAHRSPRSVHSTARTKCRDNMRQWVLDELHTVYGR
jgi:glycosyltransferase involved in cell wall biosynthesis